MLRRNLIDDRRIRSKAGGRRPPVALSALAGWAGKLRNRYFVLLDILLLPLVTYVSFVLRLGGWDLGAHEASAVRFAILATILGPIVFYAAGIYSRFWQYASVEDLVILYLAVALLDGLVTGILLVGTMWDLPGTGEISRTRSSRANGTTASLFH